ncbi:MAG: hypothetical protein R3286_09155 [Gammaproteobacteria bacterium]|nr:hypothetical protein [Gammaproteobacteria bacterium]
MPSISKQSTLSEVAALVSDALQEAGIAATLSGGGAVSIYSENVYQSVDLDFVTAAMIEDLKPALATLGFRHTGGTRLSQFVHPLVEWYVEFTAAPLTFGNLRVDHDECSVIDTAVGRLRIVSPTQSVMDRLAASIHWGDPQARDQAILVAINQEIDWQSLEAWFDNEGAAAGEFERFRKSVESSRQRATSR